MKRQYIIRRFNLHLYRFNDWKMDPREYLHNIIEKDKSIKIGTEKHYCLLLIIYSMKELLKDYLNKS